MNWPMRFLALSDTVPGYRESWITFLVDNTVKATLVLIAAYALSLALRRASAAARHLIWTSAVLSLLALPLLSLVLPAWKVHIVPEPQIQAPRAVRVKDFSPPQTSSIEVKAAPAPAKLRPARPASRHRSQLAWPLWVWALGLVAVLVRLLIGMARIWRITRSSKAIMRSDWSNLLGELRFRLRLDLPITLLESDRAAMPMTWGLLRPVILLPKNAGQWPLDRARVVLLHELAHMKRQDCLTQVLAQVACALYWFHPLVWTAARQVHRERERACDDLVLSLGTRASDYAGHLLELARSLHSQSWSMAVPMAQPSALESRMLALLDPGQNRRVLTRRSTVLIGLAAAALILPMAALRAWAGKETGKIWGTVYDASGAVVPGALVKASNRDANLTLAGVTGDTGEYEFPGIVTGHYLVEVRAGGFKESRKDVVLEANAEMRIDATLDLNPVAMAVTVAAKSRRGGHAAPPGVPRRIRVGGSVEAAKLVFQPKPDYPEGAQEKGIEGTVLLESVIGVDGNVLDAAVRNEADPELANSALDAVRQWRYQPALLNGEPVEVVTTITVNFRLVE